MLVVMFLYMMTSVIDLNTLNLNPKLFGPIWIRIRIQVFFVNFERKNKKMFREKQYSVTQLTKNFLGDILFLKDLLL